MTEHQPNEAVDIAIIGGGLAGGLIALALAQHRCNLNVAVLEAGETAGGNHRWSWFESDLGQRGAALLAPFRKAEWDGYSVAFPGYERDLPSAYRSLSSEDFAHGLRRELADGTLRTGAAVQAVEANRVVLADGGAIAARTVIDCRTAEPSRHLTGGWQVFMGRHLLVREPHGLTRPIIMDATVDQLGGYRFVYVLPLGAHQVFIEDTYYQDSSKLGRAALSTRLDAYAAAQGWDYEIVSSETGVLPVLTGGDPVAHRAAQAHDGVVLAGARGLFTHPLTSYTLPFAVETALFVADHADLPGQEMASLVEDRAQAHWRDTGFYRLLGRMLFEAAEPDQRVRVFERFYRLSPGLIERFYAGRSSFADKARILIGKPPVPVSRAIPALLSSGRPMQGGSQ